MYIATESTNTAYESILRHYTHKLQSGIVMCLGGNQHMKSGVGKSYTGLKTGEVMDRDYRNYDGKKYKQALNKVAWSPKDFKNAMNEMEKKQIYGQVVIVDEAGILVNRKKWYSFINQAISDTVMTMRNLRGIAIFIAPSVWKIEKDIREYVTLLGTCKKVILGGSQGSKVGVEVDLRRCYWDDQYNKLRAYHPRLYVQDQKRILQFTKFIPPLPRNEKLIEDYEEKAMGYKRKVRKIIEDMSSEELEVSDIINEVLADPETYIKNTKFGRHVTNDTIRFKFGVSADFARYTARQLNEKLEEKGLLEDKEKEVKGGGKTGKPKIQPAAAIEPWFNRINF